MQGCGKTVRKWVRCGDGAGPGVGFQVGLGVTPAAAWGVGFWVGQYDPEHRQVVLAPVSFVSTDLESVVGRPRADLDAGDRGKDVGFVVGRHQQIQAVVESPGDLGDLEPMAHEVGLHCQ